MAARKKPSIPPVKRGDREVVAFAERVRESVEVLQGQRGNRLDRAVTFRDLQDTGVLTSLKEGFRGVGGVPPESPPTDLTPSPIPTGFEASAGFEYALLVWDEPNYGNHAYTEVWINDTDDLSTATLHGTAEGTLSIYTVFMDPDTTRYFWVRFVNTAGVPGQYNATAGTPATTAIDVSYVLQELSGQIREDQLFADLASRINLIDGPASLVGSVDERISASESLLQNQIDSINSTLADFEAIPLFDTSTSYAVDEIVKYDGGLYKCILATTAPSPVPTNATYWEKIGDYASLSDAVAAHAQQLSDHDTRITGNDNDILAQATDISNLQSTVNDPATGLSTKASISYVDQTASNIYGSAVSSFAQIAAEFNSQQNQIDQRATLTYVDTAIADEEQARVQQYEALDAAFRTLGDSLTNPLSVVGEEFGWALFGSLPGNVTTASLAMHNVGGRNLPSLRTVTTSGHQHYSDWFDIESDSIYEVSVTAYIGTNGRSYLGLHTRGPGEGGHTTNVAQVDQLGQVSGAGNSNPYWNTNLSKGGWVTYRAYILGPNAPAIAIPEAENVPIAGFQLANGQTRARLRLLSGYSISSGSHECFWTNVTVRKVTTALSAGERNLSQAVVDAENNAVQTATQQVYSTLGGNESYVQARVAAWDGTSAQWEVRSDANGVLNGVGFINEGGTTRMYVNADRFAVYDENAGLPQDPADAIPFIVEGGVVYIKEAAIKDASIESAKIKDGFLDTLTAVHGRLDIARIKEGDIFDLTVGNEIKSSNYSSGSAGWRIARDGSAEFQSGTFRGNILVGNPSTVRSDLNVANGADVTSQNTAYDTARVAGTTASTIRDRANNANTRVNDWVRPGYTLIDGNKIFTGDAYVDTLQIQGNAVVVPVYDEFDGIETAPGYTYLDSGDGMPSINVPISVGSSESVDIVLLFFARYQGQASNASDIELQLRNGTTILQTIGGPNTIYTVRGVAGFVSGSYRITKQNGTHNFNLRWRAFGPHTLWFMSLMALAVQR